MHDILEGSLELCMRHLLIHLVQEDKLFTLHTLNARITSIKYGPTEVRNKPSEITATSLASDGRLKQSGMYSMCGKGVYIYSVTFLCCVLQLLKCGV